VSAKDHGPNAACPCHSGKKYKRCCGPAHGGVLPATPEALMRSRYAAYALGLVDYVIETTDPEGPHFVRDRATWQAQVSGFTQSTRFVGLEILGSGPDWVRFKAILEQDGGDASFEEQSTFVQRGGKWLYRSGK
jgi:SEC-C motif-containing protein